MMKFPNRLEELRRVAGFSREELAQAAGITRQSIGLIESGKVSPSTVVSLRLAKVLGRTVEDLFYDPSQTIEVDTVPWFGKDAESADDGQLPSAPMRAFAARVGERVLARPASLSSITNAIRPAHGVLEPIAQASGKGWDPTVEQAQAADPLTTKGRLTWFAGRNDPESTVFVSGCDAGLGLLAESLGRHSSLHEGIWFEVPNARALRELELGHTHVAAIHQVGAATHPSDRHGAQLAARSSALYGEALYLTFAEAEIGWMVPRGRKNHFSGVESLPGNRLRVVNRPRGAGVRSLFDSLLQSLSINPDEVNGYDIEVRGHLAVAEAVSEGLADVGLGHAGAAALFGLDFIPVQQETCTLVIPNAHLDHPGVKGLLETLNSDRFRRELLRFGPYDVSQTGSQADMAP